MRWTTSRNTERARVSTVHTSVAKALLFTRNCQRGCVSQTMREDGKDSRRAATAGNVWTMSPSEPSRTTRKRGSGMRSLAHRINKIASGMLLGIAHDGNADTEAGGRCALWNRVRGVIGALGVNVRTQILKQSFYVRLTEEQDIIDGAQCGDQRCAGDIREKGTPRALQVRDTGVCVHCNDQNVAFGTRTIQIASVAYMERIEAAISQHNFLADPPMLSEKLFKAFARDDFGFGASHN